MKRKFLKIYTHNLNSIKVKIIDNVNSSPTIADKTWNFIYGVCYFTGLAILTFFTFVANAFFFSFSNTGKLIWNGFMMFVKGLLKDLKQTRQFAGKRWRMVSNWSFAHAVFTFVMLAGASTLILFGLNLAAKGLELKDKIVNETYLGKFYLTKAKEAAGAYELEEAQNKFRQAYMSFEDGEKRIAGAGSGLSGLIKLFPQARDAQRLLEASKLVTEAGSVAIDFYKQSSNLKISTAGLEAPGGNSETLNNLSVTVLKISENLSQAKQQLESIDSNNVPAGQRDEFINLLGQIRMLSQAFNNTKQIFGILNGLVSGDKKILLIFENNNELRATSGFIGTYGLASVKDGKILSLHVSSIYDLDGQLKEFIMPPRPVLNVNNRWFMRDANWFGDFPKTAEKLSSFFEKEGGSTPDAIIAITPNLIEDLLKITGPVKMPEYNVILDSENFVEVAQVSSSDSKNSPLNQPKQILADFIPRLLEQLEKTGNNWPEVFEALQKNLVNKQIALYSRDQVTQNLLESFKWTGSIQPSDRDYLSLVSSNLGGTKTDLYQDQSLGLTVDINGNGEVTDSLEFTKTNKMPDLERTSNLSFLRFYVPAGSELLGNLGFDYKILEPSSDQANFKLDQDVYNTKSRTVKDLVTGTIIGQESGKTYFGNWLYVKGGESKTVKLTYKLPFKVKDPDRYSLLLQKQMGSLDFPIKITVNFNGRSIKWKNFDADDMQTNSLQKKLILDKDYLLGLVLTKGD